MGLAIIKKFVNKIRIRLISQLISGISRVLQKLTRYFNSTINFVPSFHLCPVIFYLTLLLLASGKSITTLVFKAGVSL